MYLQMSTSSLLMPLKSGQWVYFGNRSRMTHRYFLGTLPKQLHFKHFGVACLWSISLGHCYNLTLCLYSPIPLFNMLLSYTCIIIVSPEKSKLIFKNNLALLALRVNFGLLLWLHSKFCLKLNFPRILNSFQWKTTLCNKWSISF